MVFPILERAFAATITAHDYSPRNASAYSVAVAIDFVDLEATPATHAFQYAH
jgi:hypothetical protein